LSTFLLEKGGEGKGRWVPNANFDPSVLGKEKASAPQVRLTVKIKKIRRSFPHCCMKKEGKRRKGGEGRMGYIDGRRHTDKEKKPRSSQVEEKGKPHIPLYSMAEEKGGKRNATLGQ